MRIKELYETDFDELDPRVLKKIQLLPTDKAYHDAPSRREDDPDFDWSRPTQIKPDPELEPTSYEYRGQGIDGKVVKDKNLPIVIKAQRGGSASPRDNPYMAYILMSRKYQNENPFFPRIYDIKQRRGPKGHVEDYLIDMEELVPLRQAPPGVLKFLAKNLFGKELDRSYYFLADEFANMVQRAFFFPKTIKDQNLKNVFNLIKLVNKKRNVDPESADLHTGNMMIRTNVSGPQLVITDPLA